MLWVLSWGDGLEAGYWGTRLATQSISMRRRRGRVRIGYDGIGGRKLVALMNLFQARRQCS